MGIKRSRQASVSSSEDPASPYPREQSVDIKIVHLDADSAISDKPAVMRCSLPPHEPLTFDTFEAYDVHYQKTHLNRCSECQRNFPDEHFLHLHIAENHDPINAAKRDNGEKTYACLVPDCDRLCSTPPKRRLHCIDKHQFPRNYDFFIVNDGIDRRSSMLQPPHRRRSSAMGSSKGSFSGPSSRRGGSFASTTADSMEIVNDNEKHEHSKEEDSAKREPLKLRGRGGFSHARGLMRSGGRGTPSLESASKSDAPEMPTTESADALDQITSSMSALQFIPHSVRVARGRGRGRGG